MAAILEMIQFLCESKRYNSIMESSQSIPGADLVNAGLNDLAAGHLTKEACLVAIGRPRLNRLGFAVPVVEQPEAKLYALLAKINPDDAHSQYNALIRRLVSFERALECAKR